MAKIVEGYIKLQVPAGKANPAPPIGTALGPKGLNLMEFCKAFNAQTAGEKPGVPLPIVITYYKDKSFTFVVKTPPVSYFLKEASKVTKGCSAVGKGTFVGEITWAQILEIAKIKMKDMNANDVEAAARMVAGSAVSMGIKVIK